MKKIIVLILVLACISVTGSWSVVKAEQNSVEITVQINDQVRTGIYTGELVDGKPQGQGNFVSNDNLASLTYDGNWNAGEIAGTGYIETEAFTVHFDNDEGKYDRVGEFKGDVYDGKPSGNGYFLSKNSSGTKWAYNGQWADGQFEGQGLCQWLDEEGHFEAGNYSRGIFSPTWGQFVDSYASYHNFAVDDKSVDFMDTHSDVFASGKNINSRLIDDSFTLSKFKKNPSIYCEKFIQANNLSVVQIFYDEVWGRAHEFSIMEDKDGTLYYGFFDGTTDLVDTTRLESIYLLPLDWSTYENVEGTELWAVCCAFTKTYEELESVLVKVESDIVYLRNEEGRALASMTRGTSFYITGYDPYYGLFTATCGDWSGYVKGTGLNISKNELLKYYQ